MADADTQTRPQKEMSTSVKATNIVVLLVLLGVSAYIIYRVVDDVSIVLFTYHPTFHVLGYLILMSNAILIMADNNFLTMNFSHQKRVTAHWIVQVCAVILITIAQVAIFTNKVKHDRPHFQSTHSIFGLITFIFTLLTVFGGVWTKYSFQLRNIVKPTLIKIFHGFLGIVVYILAVITITLGFSQMWFEESDDFMRPIITVLLIITTIYVLVKSFVMTLSRAKDYFGR